MHVAIIMNGNGEWAKQRGLAPTASRAAGVSALRNTVALAVDAGVKTLTLYAICTPGCGRPSEEIDADLGVVSSYVRADAQARIRQSVLTAGAGLVVKAGTEFSMSDEIDRPRVPCSTVFSHIDGRTIRYGGSGPTLEMVSARLSFDPAAGEPLMALLPNLIHVALGDSEANVLQTTLHLIGMETGEDGLGAGLVINRLTDVLFVQTIRAWFGAEGKPVSGWLTGLKSRRLAAAIKAMHSDIAHPWTVDELANKAGLSRSGFAAAFRSIIGEPPLGYLTNWRIYRAKALLRQGYGVAEVADRVGYESDTALSRAFKRLEGVSPGSWRASSPSMDRHNTR